VKQITGLSKKKMSIRFSKYIILDMNLEELIDSDSGIKRLKRGLEEGIVYKIPHKMPLDIIEKFQKTLLDSLSYRDPGYLERKHGCANNYRVHWDGEKQATRGKFMSWSYYPWNHDSSELFSNFKNIFVLRNRLAGLDPNKYIDSKDQDFVARIAAQFYPSGAGYMEEHIDPYNVHQFAIPTVLLSTPGVDFSDQGVFLLDEKEERVYLDKFLSFGDLFLFHTRIPHGVGVIDQHLELDESKTLGRLMMIAAVNALTNQDAFQSSSKNV
jgi:hypothetical protein